MACFAMDGRLLCRSRPHCCRPIHENVVRSRVWPASATARHTVQVKVTNLERGPAEDSMEDIMHVLKDAFNHTMTTHGNTRPDSPSEQPSSSATSEASVRNRVGSRTGPSTASASSSLPAGSTNTVASSSSSSSSSSNIAHASSKAPAVKKHKGRFGELLSAIEADMRQGPSKSSKASATKTSISHNTNHMQLASDSSASAVTSSTSNSDPVQKSSPTEQDNTGSSRGSSSSSSNTPRTFVRRVRGHRRSKQNVDLQQQQQQPSASVSAASPLPQQQQQQQQEEPSWLQHPLILSVSRKQYKPVYKGDLALPGGPAWSALRRHIAAAGSRSDLPTMNCIVMVEGDQDQTAVARAVNAPVYVCDGTRVLKDHVRSELEVLKLLGRPLVVLTDPDERGRELRLHLENLIGPLQHAFVPEQQGTSTVDGPVHSSGNRGIEHVVPGGIQKALAAARLGFPKERAVWTLDQLIERGLANAHDAGDAAVGRGAAARRRQLCAVLGFGRCSGGQLVSLLNRFCDDHMVEAAMKVVEAAEEVQ